MTDLFNIDQCNTEKLEITRKPCFSKMPAKCPRCGATYLDPSDAGFECMMDYSELEPIEFHEYVESLMNYTKNYHYEISMMAKFCLEEYEKVAVYEQAFPDMSDSQIVAFYENMKNHVEEFEEKIGLA